MAMHGMGTEATILSRAAAKATPEPPPPAPPVDMRVHLATDEAPRAAFWSVYTAEPSGAKTHARHMGFSGLRSFVKAGGKALVAGMSQSKAPDGSPQTRQLPSFEALHN